MEASEAEMCGSSLDDQQEGLELLEDSPFGDIPGSDDLWEDEISSVSLLSCYPWRDPNLICLLYRDDSDNCDAL